MGRVIVITGAGKGLGLATARRFAASGNHLVLTDRSFSAEVEEVAALAKASGGSLMTIAGDVSKEADVAGLASSVLGKHGRIDVLVNNAGILFSKPSTETSMEEWNRMISINLTGTFACIRAFLPFMLEKKSGRIINISSELGLIGFPSYAAYCASKGGIIALTKALAKEYAAEGILVNSVAPGPMETDMLKFDTIEYNDETREQIPVKRFGKPDEVAAVVEFLAGPGATYMVGQIVSPNGGCAI